MSARQSGTGIVGSSVSENRVCRRPEHESPAKKHCSGSFQNQPSSWYCEQGKGVQFIGFELKKEILEGPFHRATRGRNFGVAGAVCAVEAAEAFQPPERSIRERGHRRSNVL
jgi:hypothetical protein